MGAGRFVSDTTKATSAAILTAIAVMVVVLVVGLIGVFAFGWFTDHTADRTGKTQQEQQVNGNGGYRIAAYDSFYDQCASIQTSETALAATKAELKATTDPARKAQLQANEDAQRVTRASAINQYNADARKTATKGQFRASDLPFQIDPTEEHTTCTA